MRHLKHCLGLVVLSTVSMAQSGTAIEWHAGATSFRAVPVELALSAYSIRSGITVCIPQSNVVAVMLTVYYQPASIPMALYMTWSIPFLYADGDGRSCFVSGSSIPVDQMVSALVAVSPVGISKDSH